MGTIKLLTVLIVGLILEIALISALPEDAYIWKVQSPRKDKQSQVEVVYENYNENMLPLLSKDLTILGNAVEMIRNDECRNQCRSMVAGIHNFSSWALKFYDASAKFPEGVLAGSLYQLGNFDECLEIGQADDAPPGVYGQYCLGEVGIDVSNLSGDRNGTIWENFRLSKTRQKESISKVYWGICIPAACRPADVENVIKTVLDVAFNSPYLKLTPKIPENSCYTNTSEKYNNLEIIYISVISFLILLLVVGTALHLTYLIKNEEVPRIILFQALLGFSIILNMKKLCSSKRKNDVNFACISGIKVIAMSIIIAGHTLIFIISGPVLDINFWQKEITKAENAILLNNPLLVDTFLLLSGFLITFTVLNEFNKGRSINFFVIYLLRYIRLTPAYLIIVGYYMTLFPRLDSGPLWSRVYVERDRCLASWWANILYINNYVNTENLCMFQSWYLSVDTQLFFLAPLIIYPLYKWRKIGVTILAAVTALSILIPFIITWRTNSDPTLLVYSSELKDISTNNFFVANYIKTHMRATSYCIGLLFGYIVYRIHLSSHKLSKNTVRLGWFVASSFLLSSLISITIFYGPRINFTSVEAAFYACLHRTLWSLGTGWVLLACVTGNGGVIAKLLEHKFFLPLGRLTYSAYLINGIVVLHNVATMRTPSYLDTLNLSKMYLSSLMVTFAGALILSMMCESPILGLEKIFFSRVISGKQNTKSDKRGESEETNTTEA